MARILRLIEITADLATIIGLLIVIIELLR